MNARSKAHVLVAYAVAAVCLVVGLTGSAYAAGAAAQAAAARSQLCTVTDKANGGQLLDCDPHTAPTVTPSPSVTVAPTVQPSVTPSSSPTPSPSTSTSAPTACMPRPSACGFPDATNTGTSGALTVVNGNVTIGTAGAVYANRDVRGCVRVTAKNVVIRNVKITCDGYYAISVNTGGSSNPWNAGDAALLVENVEIDLAGQLEGKAIAFDGYTLRRAWIHGGSDCAHAGVNVVVEHSFCDIPAGGPSDGPHYDGIQSDGGRNITIRHNTIRVPYAQTSAILMSTNTSPIRDVTIVDNLVAGGGYAIYCGTDSGGPVLGTFTFSGNVIARTYFARGGYWGPVTSCPAAGWRWDA